jgi:hypothetical protein
LAYPYKPKVWVLLLSGLFFVGCAVVLGAMAYGNDRGMLINRIVELDTGGATALLWVLTACSVALVAMAGVGIASAFGEGRELVLDEAGVTVPARFSSNRTTVRYQDMTHLALRRVQGQRFLEIRHQGGKVTVAAGMLPDGVFDEIVEEIGRGVDAAR